MTDQLPATRRTITQESHDWRRHQRGILAVLAVSTVLLFILLLTGQGNGDTGSLAETNTNSEAKNAAASRLRTWWQRINHIEYEIKGVQSEIDQKIKGWLGQLQDASFSSPYSSHPSPNSAADSAAPSEPWQDGTVLWSYGAGPLGPAHWGELCSAFALCGTGQTQSPIEIGSHTMNDALLQSVGWMLEPPGVQTLTARASIHGTEKFTRLALDVQLNAGPTMVVGDKTYRLEEIRFHTPAEHVVLGSRAAGEVQFTHKATDGSGKRMIVAALLQPGDGEEGSVVEQMLDEIGKGAHSHNIHLRALSREVLVGSMPTDAASLASFHPNFRSYYQYQGSMTIPPCTEDVTWLVLKNVIVVDHQRLAALARLQGNNSRPTRPLNGRQVLQISSIEG